MDQQTWTTLLGMAGFTLALFGYLRSMRIDLKTEFKTEIGRLESTMDRTEIRMESRFDRVDERLTALEQRTYDLASRLPPPPVVQRSE